MPTYLTTIARTALAHDFGCPVGCGLGFGIVASRAALDVFTLALIQLAASVSLLGGIGAIAGRWPSGALVNRSVPSGTVEYAFTYTVFACGVAPTQR